MDIIDSQNDDPVMVYLREVANVPPLTKDEESKLWQQTKNQNEEQAELAKRRLIESRLSLVVAIAERHTSAGIPMLDLIQEGNIGLLVALEIFGGSSSDDFSALAATCIEDAISNAIAESQSR